MQNSIDVIKDIPARKLDDPEKRGTGTSREQKADFQGKHLCEAARENKVIDETASLLVIPCSFCALAAAITSCATLPTEAAAGITTTEAIDPPKHNTHEHEREREREREREKERNKTQNPRPSRKPPHKVDRAILAGQNRFGPFYYIIPPGILEKICTYIATL
jgi:hypothetical protein